MSDKEHPFWAEARGGLILTAGDRSSIDPPVCRQCGDVGDCDYPHLWTVFRDGTWLCSNLKCREDA